jgi:hypothetical protein
MSKVNDTPQNPAPEVGSIDADTSNHKQTVIPEKTAFAFSPELLDVAGLVNPSQPTIGAVMPDAPVDPEPKRGRGRPAGAGAKKKAAPTDAAVSVALANAEMMVGALDLLRAAVSGGECQPDVTVRGAAVASWREYLEEAGLELPSWAKVALISVVYVAPAFATPAGKSKTTTMWQKAKSWWTLARG